MRVSQHIYLVLSLEQVILDYFLKNDVFDHYTQASSLMIFLCKFDEMSKLIF